MQNKFSKKLGMIIVTILAISMISAAIPFAFATITNRPTVYDGTGATAAPIDIEAGTTASLDTTGMTITGAQIWLWLSTSGGSEINTALGDRPYAGPFYLADVVDTVAPHAYTFTPAEIDALCDLLSVSSPFAAEDKTYTFTLQNNWINGTIPLMIQGDDVDYWIKICDVSPADTIAGSEIGVSTNRVHFTPGFYATPLMGAPETMVTVSGYALPAANEYNVTEDGALALGLLTPTTHDVDGWLWTGFSDTFNVSDLNNTVIAPGPAPESTMVDIEIWENDTATLLDTFQFEQMSREVYLEEDFVGDTGTYSAMVLDTGDDYELMMEWFPAYGSATVYLGESAVLNGVMLNSTGGATTTFTVPPLTTGSYTLAVMDSNDVWYNITVSVAMSPSITLTPNSGYVGDTFIVTGTNFLDYVDDVLTIYFENDDDSPYYTLMANFTCPASTWTQTLTVPHSFGGGSLVEVRNIDGTSEPIDDATFTVLAMLTVDPSEFSNDCSLVSVMGTGLEVWDDYTEYRKTYAIAIDNQFLGASGSMYRANGQVAATTTGDLVFEIVANGFRPGTHVVAIYGDSRGSYVDGDIDSYSPAAYTCFNVTAEGDPIINGILTGIDLTALNAEITAISGDVATILTDVGTIQASLTSLNAKVTSISNDIANIEIPGFGTIETKLDSIDTVIGSMYGDVVSLDTAIGSVETTLDALDATVSGVSSDMTALAGDVAALTGDVVSIDTVLGSVAGTVTDMDGTLATIETDLGTVQVDLSYLKGASADTQATLDENLPVDMLPVWIAVILSLIAAIGAIAGVFIIQRKIA